MTPAISAPPLVNGPGASFKRLAYIDWMRGLACVLMIQAHCYDSWLSAGARKTVLYRWSQEISTLAAPIFIFLAGVSFALVTERLRQKKTPAAEIFKIAT
ncbi:MAG: acyltransferase family protein, partial [Candidatus Acidiferrum sp.]